LLLFDPFIFIEYPAMVNQGNQLFMEPQATHGLPA